MMQTNPQDDNASGRPVVVFDVGNVLLRWDPDALLRAHFPNQAAAIAQQVFGSAHWKELDRGALSRPAAEAAAVQASALDEEQVRTLFDAMPASLARIEPLIELAAELHRREVPIYILSNMPAYVQTALEARHNFFSLFDGAAYSHECLTLKPEPAIYRLLLERYGLEKTPKLFIDDSPANLTAAGALGFSTLHHPPDADEALSRQVADQVIRWVEAAP